LILEHLGLVQSVVAFVSSRYPRHVERDELWNAGACGLVEAARRYRPETAVPFARYARMRIRGAVIDSTRDRDLLGRTMRRNLRDLHRLERSLQGERGAPAGDEQLAAVLDCSVERLRRHRAASEAGTVVSFENDAMEAWAEQPGDISPDQLLEEREVVGTILTAVRHLPEPQRSVVTGHYLAGERLADIAERMGVTEARASQVASEGINAIRSYMSTIYDGVVAPPRNAPGKRSRAAYVTAMSSASTWRERIAAGDLVAAI
jgi:RNA polymerase sigma factor for flagellar operon FliA